MKATKLLIQQHKEVDALFKKFEKTDDDGERDALFEEIGAKLAAHDAIEREIFYPACQAALDEEDLLGEALVEHGVVEFSIYKADIADAEDLGHCVKVLSEIVEHHVEEEEKELFPKVEKAMSAEQLEELGAQMEERFEAALEEDFREAVRANLEQVLAGAVETEPADDDVPSEKRPTQSKAKASAKKAAPKKVAAKKSAAAPKKAARR